MPFLSFTPNTVISSTDMNTNFNNTVHMTDLQKIYNKIPVMPLGVTTDAATITFDLSANSVWAVSLGGNRTLALTNVSLYQPFMIKLVQDATGSRTVTWWSTIRWPGGVAPTLTTTSYRSDYFGFIYIGSGVYDAFIVGQGLA